MWVMVAGRERWAVVDDVGAGRRKKQAIFLEQRTEKGELVMVVVVVGWGEESTEQSESVRQSVR